MIKLAQIGFLVGMIILIALVIGRYPLIAATALGIAILVGAILIGRA